jgi:betaine-aldehyde dehydrogenase
MSPPFDKGFFHEPTVFSGVEQDMRICQQEIFGPVLSVLSSSAFEEALEKANDVTYGLAASAWTKDITKVMKASAQLRFGDVWVNDHLPPTSEIPHGGFKQNGFGKEDMSTCTFDDYTGTKFVYVDTTDTPRKPWNYTVYGD